MPPTFQTPQDAEDAFYDALDAQDLDALMRAWADSDEIACLLPMRPLVMGRAGVRDGWREALEGAGGMEVEVRHQGWMESADLAVHCVEERVRLVGRNQPMPPMYATNIYRRAGDGWRLILHQNSPAPPPAPPVRRA